MTPTALATPDPHGDDFTRRWRPPRASAADRRARPPDDRLPRRQPAPAPPPPEPPSPDPPPGMPVIIGDDGTGERIFEFLQMIKNGAHDDC